MSRRFKDQALQGVYDWFRQNKPGEAGKSRGACGNAYWVGRYRPNPDRPFAQRGSATYAAWAAGIDDWKESLADEKAKLDHKPEPAKAGGES